MEKHIPVTGGCLCGAVRYESAEPPVDVSHCHCRMCQQSCGGPSFLGAFIPKAAFRFTRGRPKFYKSSAWAERGFCADCGTPLMMRDLTDTHAIYIGTLDHPEDWPPTLCHSGMESHIPWDAIHDDLPRWRTDDDPEFVATRSELEKLSRLAEDGAITQAEFERRREAMFSGQA
jgi:hypothetical protein